MPWLFKRAKLGTLVGKRTWGGLVGILGFPPLIDGTGITAPNLAFFNPEGQWDVENHGTDPDVEVDFDPHAWRQGKDPQLERAVSIAMAELAKNPPQVPRKPVYPDYHNGSPLGGQRPGTATGSQKLKRDGGRYTAVTRFVPKSHFILRPSR